MHSRKTADYHRHILSLPIFVNKAFKKMKTLFFSKKYSFFIIVSNFSTVQSFLIFCRKNLIFRLEDILKKKTIRYAINSKLPPLATLNKNQDFFPINSFIFSKKTQTLNVLRNLTFAISAILAISAVSTILATSAISAILAFFAFWAFPQIWQFQHS